MNEFKYNIGYALSGGFIKGFAHLGIMQALHEHGIRPEILSGVSAGALAAVFYADGKEPYHIVELFEHHSFKELTTFSINKQGLLKLDSFIDFLNSNLESKTIEELKIPTIITATQGITNVIFKFIHSLISFRYRQTYEYFCEMP